MFTPTELFGRLGLFGQPLKIVSLINKLYGINKILLFTITFHHVIEPQCLFRDTPLTYRPVSVAQCY